VIDVSKATRYITVATYSDDVRKEWRDRGINPPPVEYNDYALLKVLYLLRKTTKRKYVVHPFAAQKDTVTSIDFSTLQKNDVIFVVGHGDHNGLYAMGPSADDNGKRLLKCLTNDGNLKRLRSGKQITIVLLSCRAGLGLYQGVSKRLADSIGIQTIVGGARGFTFGSIRTVSTALNEVLIKGIPWRMEYENSISQSAAETETSNREGKTITMGAKQNEIAAFIEEKKALEKEFKNIAEHLAATEINNALDEIESKHSEDWLGLCQLQFMLYGTAKKRSELEFDMWHDLITEGYFWADSKKITAAEADAVFTGTLTPTDDGLISIR